MWLDMMIEHHEGAVEMAKSEQDDGQYKLAVDLAADIAKSQTAEIETMQGLLDPGHHRHQAGGPTWPHVGPPAPGVAAALGSGSCSTRTTA